MPLSRKANRDRMRRVRLHKKTCATQTAKAVQPKLEELRAIINGIKPKSPVIRGSLGCTISGIEPKSWMDEHA